MPALEQDAYRCLVRQGPRADPAPVAALPSEPLSFHRRIQNEPTRLVSAPGIARRLGTSKAYVKDESGRMGTYAFKALGASWALFRLLCERVGPPPPDWRTTDDLASHFARVGDLTFVAATDGNHGHALACSAARFGFRARILIPEGAPEARVARIAAAGAEVVLVDGSYDDAVALASQGQAQNEICVPDTAWEGYEVIATWVSEGYGTLFAEIDEQLGSSLSSRDLVSVQIGVGTFASTAVRHYRQLANTPCLVGTEAITSACVMASVSAGHSVTVDGPHESRMDCLNAGVASTVALPLLTSGLDVFTAIADDFVDEALGLMTEAGIDASPTGASGLAGLLALSDSASGAVLRGRDRVILVNTEGPIEDRRSKQTR